MWQFLSGVQEMISPPGPRGKEGLYYPFSENKDADQLC